jgi:ubiquinone/menaquinone biosynthesis C-methylase UbiE
MSGSNERGGIHNVLRIPATYNLVENLLGAERATAMFLSEYIKPKENDVILDFGAGTGAIYEKLKSTSNLTYVAIEPNPAYVAQIKERFDKNSQHLALVGTVDKLVELNQKFDKILLVAVLHHLDRELIDIVLRELPKYLNKEGELITLDPIKHKSQNLIAKLLIALDRGKSIMSIEEYQKVLLKHNKDFKIYIRKDLLNVPYSHVISILQKK